MKYFNKIVNEYTKYPFRFKTNKELIDEYGNNWDQIIVNGWVDDMNIFFGKTLEYDANETELKNGFIDYGYIFYKGWCISENTLTPNVNSAYEIYNKSKNLVYEGKEINFDYVVFKPKNDVELINAQRIGLLDDYTWVDGGTYYSSHSTSSIHAIVFDTNQKFLLLSGLGFRKKTDNFYKAYYPNSIILNNINDLERLFKTGKISAEVKDIYKDRKLVYERIENKKYDIIILRTNFNEELSSDAQNYAFEFNFYWDDVSPSYNVSYTHSRYLYFDIKTRKIHYTSGNGLPAEDTFIRVFNSINYIIIDNFKDFKDLIKNDGVFISNKFSSIYDLEKPKLVYEELSNEINNAYEICVKFKNQEEINNFNNFYFNEFGINEKIKFTWGIVNFPVYVFIDIISTDIKPTKIDMGNDLDHYGLESGGINQNYMFNGVYETVFYYGKDSHIIKDTIKNKKVTLSSISLYNNNNRKNIYENSINLYEARNTKEEAIMCCLKIDNNDSLDKIIELSDKYIPEDIVNVFEGYKSFEKPMYIFYGFKDNSASWMSDYEGSVDGYETGNICNISYLSGCYDKVYNINEDKYLIEKIFKEKKIPSEIPYYLKTNKNVYESVSNKPGFFSRTYYRIPNEEEIDNIDSCNLSAKEILDGFKYTIIGKGIIDNDKKDMIIKSIKLLLNKFPDKLEYKLALKIAKNKIL